MRHYFFFCTMDGFSRILEKKLSELLCTRLYIATYFDCSHFTNFLENGAKKDCSTFFSGKRKPLNWNGCLLLLLVNGLPSSPKGGGGCSFGFGFQEPFNGDSISSLIKSFYFTLYLLICQLHRSGSALNCG